MHGERPFYKSMVKNRRPFRRILVTSDKVRMEDDGMPEIVFVKRRVLAHGKARRDDEPNKNNEVPGAKYRTNEDRT